MDTLLLDSGDVDENAQMGDVVAAVEAAFAAYEDGRTLMPAKSYVDLPKYNGDFRSMPAYMAAEDWDAAGIKWVNVHPDNPEQFDLPTVMGTMIYSDPETAVPLAIMDGTELTMKRTGAAAAVATDHLAVEDATSLGIVGAGVQSYTQLDAIAQVRDIQTVVVSDVRDDAIERFQDVYGDAFDVQRGDISDAGHCDVVSTVTPVEDPIVGPEDVGDHTHVNAMGADAEGKHEIEDDVLLDAKVVIDDFEQCTHSGEINVPFSEGVMDADDIYGEIGEIVTGAIDGRTNDDDVTVFDSTGLAIQDVAAAHVVYEHAFENDNGTPFELIQT
ncbi:ornithine cyclodeaminase family protein [Halorubellus sp. JP-L1]|uniref:ornithine cyclodeaminase family protein n=1 Tax=Halorubellus sp. JP-L1 TaxID=2715753 RepID=UPI0014081253|nr:ornithine cyclodeaminase family protein [Halorubellus sp. JP-L1]NHN43494.1 ornithine cyclodeaminase family protein [Halorubellus sp. JP-L1]